MNTATAASTAPVQLQTRQKRFMRQDRTEPSPPRERAGKRITKKKTSK